MPEIQKKPRVFVSYSMKDTGFARDFVGALKRHGFDAWFDQFEIAPGSPIREEIGEALRKSDAVVILLTEDSIKRPNVFFELVAGNGLGKTVITIISKDL